MVFYPSKDICFHLLSTLEDLGLERLNNFFKVPKSVTLHPSVEPNEMEQYPLPSRRSDNTFY